MPVGGGFEHGDRQPVELSHIIHGHMKEDSEMAASEEGAGLGTK